MHIICKIYCISTCRFNQILLKGTTFISQFNDKLVELNLQNIFTTSKTVIVHNLQKQFFFLKNQHEAMITNY